MKGLTCIVLTILSFNSLLLNGQIPYFHQYHPFKRNQPVQINTVFQDKAGFIWLGTHKGLFRFDGTEHRHYPLPDSLINSPVTALAEDSLGRIWMGHENGQISYVEKNTIRMFAPREGSAVEAISDILFDKQGRMWFSTRNDGLYYYENSRLYRIDEQEGLPDLFVYDLFEDAVGNIWAGTDAGIAICSLASGKITIRVIDADDGLADIIIRKIAILRGDTLALATEDAGVLVYHPGTNHIEPLVRNWTLGSISDFAVKENRVWIAVPRKGVAVVDRQTKVEKLFRDYQGISLLSVNDLLRDREGNIWLGSKTCLSRTRGDAVEHLENLEPLRDINVLALAIDAKNRIWFSTNEGLFMRSVNAEGSFTIIKKLLYTGFQNAPVISLYADNEGYIWAGLYGSGLLRINTQNDKIKHFQQELRNGNVLGITGRGNSVWVATLGGTTYIEFKDEHYVFRNYGSGDGLGSDFIYQVFIDSRNRKWFGSDGKGVTMLDEKGFHYFEKGLPSKVIYSFAEDVNHDIWVSSQENGVLKFDGQKFVQVSDLRLRDNSIQSIFADRHGNLVAMHNFGIDVFNVRTGKMRHWGEESGFRDKHPNLNSVATDQFGHFYIGTGKGIIKFSLQNDQVATTPEPAIDQVLIYDEPVDFENTPKWSYNENNITIKFLGFWYQNAENVNYLYKLENYDLEWISTRNQQVTYSRLPPGDYTFRVKASDTEDFGHALESTVSFSISPPFWRTGTFYVIIVAMFVISAYGLMKFRERKLLQDKLILEAKVEQRTKEIQLKTEEIQAQNEEIMAQAEEIQGINENLEMLVKQRTAELEKKNKALEEYAFINAHKLRSPVASILGLVHLLAKSDQKDDTKVIREHLKNSADKLDAVVRSITTAIEKADNI